MSFEKALVLDNTTIHQPAAALDFVAKVLSQLKTERPYVWKTLCEHGLLFGDFTLEDSLTAVNFALEELNKVVEAEQCSN